MIGSPLGSIPLNQVNQQPVTNPGSPYPAPTSFGNGFISTIMGSAPANLQSGLQSIIDTNAGAQGVAPQLVDPATGLNNALGFYSSYYGPQQMQLDMQQDSLQNQQNLVLSNQQFNTDWLNKMYGIDSRGIDLQRKGLDIDKGAAGRQLGNIGSLEELAAKMFGLQNQGFDLEGALTKRKANTDRRKTGYDATARGAYTSQGFRDDLSDILFGENNQLSQIENQRGRAGIGYEREKLDLNEQRNRVKDRQAALDLQAQQLGLDSEKLRANLDQGLQRLNLDTMMDTNKLLDSLNSSRLEERMLGEQILREAIGNSGMFEEMAGVNFR